MKCFENHKIYFSSQFNLIAILFAKWGQYSFGVSRAITKFYDYRCKIEQQIMMRIGGTPTNNFILTRQV
jgi:hypothetical protein